MWVVKKELFALMTAIGKYWWEGKNYATTNIAADRSGMKSFADGRACI